MNLRHFLNRFRKDERGVFTVWVIAIPMVIVITLAWLISVFIINTSLDSMEAAAAAAHPAGLSIVESLRTNGAIFIVVIDVLILVWAAVMSFKKERQEFPI